MDEEELMSKFDSACLNNDQEVMRNMMLVLFKCSNSSNMKDQFCVIDLANQPYEMFSGTMSECAAFVEGYETAPGADYSGPIRSELCICVDKMIVIPNERLGQKIKECLFN